MITANSLNQLLPLVCDQFLQELTANGPAAFEEGGGFIFTRDGEFKFEHTRNSNTGTPLAAGLYTADVEEYSMMLYTNIKTKWHCMASFHTHPPGCPPWPSMEDLSKLFKSYPTNFIYSPDIDTLARYDYDKENQSWLAQKVKIR